MGETHWFVDETKAGTFVVVVAAVPAETVTAFRKSLRGLLRPGQRSLHFTKENDTARRTALQLIVGSSIEVLVYRWVADALAWCIQRGRPWTERISQLPTRTIDLP